MYKLVKFRQFQLVPSSIFNTNTDTSASYYFSVQRTASDCFLCPSSFVLFSYLQPHFDPRPSTPFSLIFTKFSTLFWFKHYFCLMCNIIILCTFLCKHNVWSKTERRNERKISPVLYFVIHTHTHTDLSASFSFNLCFMTTLWHAHKFSPHLVYFLM